jgi:hypothetical protein
VSFCLDLPNSATLVGHWFYDWQTLISGLLALGGAAWAGSLLSKQIKLAEALPEIERSRKFLAARCLLPIHLTEILGYCRLVAEGLIPLQQSQASPTEDAVSISPSLPFPHSSVIHLTRAIELSNEPCFIAICAKIISELQVLTSRTADIQSVELMMSKKYPSNIEIYIIQAAKIYGMTSSLFGFARQETETPPCSVSWDGASTALNVWNVYEDHFPQALAYIARKKASGAMFECDK